MNKEETLYKIFPEPIRELLRKAGIPLSDLQEIRMRAGKPFVFIRGGKEQFLPSRGELSEDEGTSHYTVSRQELQETVSYVSGYSLYAFDEELKQGYITLPGGHRVGVAGRIVADQDRIQCVKYISFLNIRVSHEIKGCADQVLPYLLQDGRFCHTLIISPPKCGKTTLLRDIIRQLSDGYGELPGQNVGVVDERSEIGGSYQGIPQNDLGMRTDVLDCCPKALGMMMLIRSMAPDIVAVDEIGDDRDCRAIETVIHCGCRLLATVHGTSVEDIMEKPLFHRFFQYHLFERYVVLDQENGPGHVREIFDGRGTQLYV